MTFDEIRSAIESSNLTLQERRALISVLRRPFGHRPSPRRGARCAINHPGLQSLWYERVESRVNRKNERVVYIGTYCYRCSKSYPKKQKQRLLPVTKPSRARTPPVACGCPHRSALHTDGECYHQNAAGEYDCDCTSGKRRKQRAIQEAAT